MKKEDEAVLINRMTPLERRQFERLQAKGFGLKKFLQIKKQKLAAQLKKAKAAWS